MTENNPIGDVGRTLRSLLLMGMGTWSVEEDQIALTSPDRFESNKVGLSVHLYRVEENPHLANEYPAATGETRSGAGRLVLQLHYLLTAHPADGETVDTSDTLDQHRMLSTAIQTLRKNATVRGSDLQGSLAGGDPLTIAIDRGATDHVADIWTTFQETPYLPSISYMVTPVVIETADEEAGPPVIESRMEYVTEAGDRPLEES